ncbi:MAG: hypothetical protein JST12_08820 [Armatimonadetes bacterium]|nr:hypothetical protein [Armatimonadota bacterium]MBS1701751.1 hypothetical protein [Armatimonadota bacterium]MBS1728699.1 hypothetical protein [Armatimonadota bacterium]
MKAWTAVPIVLFVLIASSGCRFKSPESFQSATTKIEYPATIKGDKYSNGGEASATGGTKVTTQYGAGAKTGPGTTMDTQRDQPAMGTGTRPGENPGVGTPNGPAYQGNPSDFQASTGGNRG